MANETKNAYGLDTNDAYVHNESTKWRQRQDNNEEDNLFRTFLSHNLFSKEAPEDLQNIASKDLVTKEIECDLLAAKQKGQEQLNQFVEERILPCENRKVKFRDPLTKNKTLTFSIVWNWEQRNWDF